MGCFAEGSRESPSVFGGTSTPVVTCLQSEREAPQIKGCQSLLVNSLKFTKTLKARVQKQGRMRERLYCIKPHSLRCMLINFKVGQVMREIWGRSSGKKKTFREFLLASWRAFRPYPPNHDQRERPTSEHHELLRPARGAADTVHRPLHGWERREGASMSTELQGNQ